MTKTADATISVFDDGVIQKVVEKIIDHPSFECYRKSPSTTPPTFLMAGSFFGNEFCDTQLRKRYNTTRKAAKIPLDNVKHEYFL